MIQMPEQNLSVRSSYVSPSKPCFNCRRRKVRCDKAKPCSNCTRFNVICNYDEEHDDTDVRQRLERLEQLIESMGGIALSGAGQSTKQTDPPKSSLSQSRKPNCPGLWTSDLNYNEEPRNGYGFQVFEPGVSAHLGLGYWMTMFEQTDELRFVLRGSTNGEGGAYQQGYAIIIGLGLRDAPSSLEEFHPSLDQSELLVKHFIEGVEPFIRLTHRQTFIRELQLWRSGQLNLPPYANEFEAMLLAIYALTVTTLRSEVVEKLFGEQKETLVARFQLGAEKALVKFDIFRSRKPMLFKALLYYIKFLYERGRYDTATPLMGLAVRKAQQMGILRDPRFFNHPPWVSDMRRRMFTFLYHLDTIALEAEGVESALPSSTWDTGFPTNADDRKWEPSRFASEGFAPADDDGYSAMTFVLLRRELEMLLRAVLHRLRLPSLQNLKAIVHKTATHLNNRYLQRIDSNQPMQRLVGSYTNIFVERIRLIIDHALIQHDRGGSSGDETNLFEDAILILEHVERFQVEFEPLNWDWLFRGTVLWHTTAVLLFNLGQRFEGPDVERAWRQVEIVFARHNNNDIQLRHTLMWRFLDQARERALFNKKTGKASQGSSSSNFSSEWLSEPFDETTLNTEVDASMEYLAANGELPSASQPFFDFPINGPGHDTRRFGSGW